MGMLEGKAVAITGAGGGVRQGIETMCSGGAQRIAAAFERAL
jgi:hypothetical protein